MKRVSRVMSVLAVVVLVSPLLAQSKPNFAGTWTVVVDPNAPATGRGRGGAGFGMGPEFTAAQDEKTLTVTSNTPQAGETKSVYNLDGSENKNPLSANGQTIDRVSKAKWDGARLVITSTLSVAGQSGEVTQTWSLEASGNLVLEQIVTFAGNAATTKTTYSKKG